MSQMTKRALAAALKTLMEKKPFSKITVKDLTLECGINRMTFYYHFEDIYDLVRWIFKNDIFIYDMDWFIGDDWQTSMIEFFNRLVENRSFIVNTCRSMVYENLNSSLRHTTSGIFERVVNKLSEGINISDENKHRIALFYTTAFTGVILNWILMGMEEGTQEMVSNLSRMLDGSIALAIRNMSDE